MKFAAASLLALSALGAIASPIDKRAGSPIVVSVKKDLTKSKAGIVGRDQARWKQVINADKLGKRQTGVPVTNAIDSYLISTG